MLPNPEKALTIYNIPDKIKSEIDDWHLNGKPPGDLIAAILSNNLIVTMTKMDKVVGKNIEEIIQYINQELSPQSWGSVENMKSWFKWKKSEEKTPLNIIQMQEGFDTKRQVRALQEALKMSNLVVEETLKAQYNANLDAIRQKAVFALQGLSEESLAIKVGS